MFPAAQVTIKNVIKVLAAAHLNSLNFIKIIFIHTVRFTPAGMAIFLLNE